MARLAAAGAAHASCLTNRIWREVIVQHELGFGQPAEPVNELLIIGGTERGHTKRLGFAARKQG